MEILSGLFIGEVVNVVDDNTIEVKIPEISNEPIKATYMRSLTFGDNSTIKLNYQIQPNSKVVVQFIHNSIYEAIVIGQINNNSVVEDFIAFETDSYKVFAKKDSIKVEMGSTELEIKDQKVSLKATMVEIQGNLNVIGNVSCGGLAVAGGGGGGGSGEATMQNVTLKVAGGDVVADGISLKNHKHIYITPLHPAGSGNTGPAT